MARASNAGPSETRGKVLSKSDIRKGRFIVRFGTLELRSTRQGDIFHPLDGSSAEDIGPGEMAYASGNEILTRHYVWKQSRKGLLDESTGSLFFVAEVL